MASSGPEGLTDVIQKSVRHRVLQAGGRYEDVYHVGYSLAENPAALGFVGLIGKPNKPFRVTAQYASLTDLVAAAGEQGPEFEPGSKFWYSDVGSDVVAALVAKISGEPIEKFVQREIFDPLEMSNTFYGIDASDKRLMSAASSYMKMPKEWIRFWNPEKPLYPFAWGSQTVYFTTTDYAKFLKMLVNRGKVRDRQLLSADAVDRMLEPVSQAKMTGSDNNMPTGFRNLKVYYGQIMITYRDKADNNAKPVAIGHSGSDGTIAWAWPNQDLMILYFTQSRGGMTPLKIEDPIDRLIIHPGVDEQVPERLQPYLGTFVANYDTFEGEEFTVTTKNGSLVLDVPSQMAFELKDEDDEGNWTEIKDVRNVRVMGKAMVELLRTDSK